MGTRSPQQRVRPPGSATWKLGNFSKGSPSLPQFLYLERLLTQAVFLEQRPAHRPVWLLAWFGLDLHRGTAMHGLARVPATILPACETQEYVCLIPGTKGFQTGVLSL